MENTDINAYLQPLQNCGRFQILITIFAISPRVIAGMCIYFMAFGSYNPGWRCLDDVSNTNTYSNDGFPNATIMASPNITTNKSTEYLFDSCDVFEACQRVEFNPAASTIVTEWGLLCSRAWIPSVIISIMMAGLPVGTMMMGYFGDRFGRKWIIYIGIFMLGVLHLMSMYSVNWEMFAAIRFFMGIACGLVVCGPMVLLCEFIPAGWRPAVQSIPTWNVGLVLFSLCAMATHNARTLEMITAIISFVMFLPCVWVPESLRWLITKGKQEESKSVLKKIAEMNKIDILLQGEMIEMLNKGDVVEEDNKTAQRHTFIELFKKRFMFTSVIAVCYFSVDLIYFASNFGVAFFPGNFYVNMIIMAASELPSNIIAALIPNIAGRRISVVSALLLGSFSFTGVAFIDIFTSSDTRIYGILGLVGVGKMFMNCAMYVMNVQVLEIYPTVFRSTAVGFSYFMAGFGSILAPYLIPTSEDQLHVNYFITGALLIICTILALQLPETKGKSLSDTWEEEF